MARKKPRKSDKNKVLYVVHTMGKVASQAVAETLQNAGKNVVHAHYMIFPQREEDIKARQLVLNWPGPINVITVVRDPIARNLSAYFQNVLKDDEEPSVVDFLGRYRQRIPLDWYWGEFFDFWGMGMNGFNKGRGIAVYPAFTWPRNPTNGTNLFIFRADSLGHFSSTLAMAGFGEIENPKAKSVNTSESYLQFCREAKFPPEYVEEMYWSLYARAFWTDEELDQFRERWLAK